MGSAFRQPCPVVSDARSSEEANLVPRYRGCEVGEGVVLPSPPPTSPRPPSTGSDSLETASALHFQAPSPLLLPPRRPPLRLPILCPPLRSLPPPHKDLGGRGENLPPGPGLPAAGELVPVSALFLGCWRRTSLSPPPPHPGWQRTHIPARAPALLPVLLSSGPSFKRGPHGDNWHGEGGGQRNKAWKAASNHGMEGDRARDRGRGSRLLGPAGGRPDLGHFPHLSSKAGGSAAQIVAVRAQAWGSPPLQPQFFPDMSLGVMGSRGLSPSPILQFSWDTLWVLSIIGVFGLFLVLLKPLRLSDLRHMTRTC
ncbi:uncharacterized protein ACOB8E_002976 [Sarcophilus harrisii]